MAFKMKGFSPFHQEEKDEDKDIKITRAKEKFTTSGIPETLYDADDNEINTSNIDEGNLSKIKKESGTNRKYVEYVEGEKAGGRLYLK